MSFGETSDLTDRKNMIYYFKMGYFWKGGPP